MAYEAEGMFISYKTAVANYSSASQVYRFVKSTASGTFSLVASSGGLVLGVLCDSPSSGQMGKIQVGGVAKVRCSTNHAAIAVGDKIRSDASGYARPSTTVVTYYVVGRALESIASNTAGVISVLLTHQGAGSTGAASGA